MTEAKKLEKKNDHNKTLEESPHLDDIGENTEKLFCFLI